MNKISPSIPILSISISLKEGAASNDIIWEDITNKICLIKLLKKANQTAQFLQLLKLLLTCYPGLTLLDRPLDQAELGIWEFLPIKIY